jgi:hypothetical protein
MRTSVVLSIAFAGLLVAGSVSPALAGQSTHLSDGQYLTAARCAGIAQALGDDTKPYDKVLDVEGGNRPNFVMDAADNARSDGARLAQRTDARARSEVALEHDGVCKAYRS